MRIIPLKRGTEKGISFLWSFCRSKGGTGERERRERERGGERERGKEGERGSGGWGRGGEGEERRGEREGERERKEMHNLNPMMKEN